MSKTFLTVDDAPSGALPEKIAVLETYDVPALFFCEGRRLADYPDEARLAIEAGYHLGNHTYSHQPASDLRVDTLRDEIERTEPLLDDAYDRAGVSRPARVFRFPFGDRGGDRTASFQRLLDELGFAPPDPEPFTYGWYEDHHAGMVDWFWTVSVDDWTVDSRPGLRAKVAQYGNRFDSDSADVVLFHDAGNTTSLFEYFLELLHDRGVEFADPLDLLQ